MSYVSTTSSPGPFVILGWDTKGPGDEVDVSKMGEGNICIHNKGRISVQYNSIQYAIHTIASVALVHTSVQSKTKKFSQPVTQKQKSLPSPTPTGSLPHWFQGNFAAMFVFELLG